MFDGLRKAWERGGERVVLDKQHELLLRDMLHSEKGSPERQTSIDAYMAFVQANLDYEANRRGWKKRGEEEDRANLEKLRTLYTDRERL